MDFELTRSILESGWNARVFPAAVLEIGRSAGALERHAVGRLRYAADAPACTVQTVFDLASLTKVIATTSFVMRLVGRGEAHLDDPIARWLPRWTTSGRAAVTLRHLLDHSSGLPAHVRLWEQARGRDEYERAIESTPLERPPGAAAVYSDLGFITLGFLIERATGRTLRELSIELAEALDLPALRFDWDASMGAVAPTEFDPWRNRLLAGEVHDENAAALGGAAGHAGLFGNAESVGRFAATVLRTYRAETWLGSPALMEAFAARSAVVGSSRALGWDTMVPTSSCGTRLSPSAIGHTGFTGTSIWIDPDRDLYVVLLSNRVHPSRDHNEIRAFRPRLHDAVVQDFERVTDQAAR